MISSKMHAHHLNLMSCLDDFFPDTLLGDLSKELLSVDVATVQYLSVSSLFRIFDSKHDRFTTERWAQEAKIKSMTTLDLACVTILLYATSMYYTSHASFKCCGDALEIEVQCVFRELSIKYGPYFTWMAMFGMKTEKYWARERLEEGIRELKDYEERRAAASNVIFPRPSVQSIVLREVSRRENGDLSLWNMIHIVVKHRLIEWRRERDRLRP
jgi:hypothetical protein